MLNGLVVVIDDVGCTRGVDAAVTLATGVETSPTSRRTKPNTANDAGSGGGAVGAPPVTVVVGSDVLGAASTVTAWTAGTSADTGAATSSLACLTGFATGSSTVERLGFLSSAFATLAAVRSGSVSTPEGFSSASSAAAFVVDFWTEDFSPVLVSGFFDAGASFGPADADDAEDPEVPEAPDDEPDESSSA